MFGKLFLKEWRENILIVFSGKSKYAETKHMFLTEECPCDNFGYRYDNSINNGEYRWKKLFVLN